MQDFSSQIKSNCSQKTRKFSQEWHEEEKNNQTFWHHQKQGHFQCTFSKIYHLEMKVWKNLKKQVTIDNISGK